MEINHQPVKLQVDCGATVCILPKCYLGDLQIRPEIVNLQMWNKSYVKALGKCKVHVRNPATMETFKVDFVIVDKDLTSLLSGSAAQAMGLITVNFDNFKVVNTVSSADHLFVQQFPDAFKDTPGTRPGKKVHLTTEDGAVPVVRCARTLPEARKDVVKAELQRLRAESIFVPVDEPTDWVSQMSVAEKKSGIRIRIDPRPLNEVLKHEEHDERVCLFLQRCCEIGISLNKEKCRFGLHEIPFTGHVVSNIGLKPDPSKVEAITKTEPPTDKAGVERLRGTVNYLSKFVPRLAEVMRPINDLARPDTEWIWDSVQDKAFEEIKHLLTQAPVLAYFDPTKKLFIQCDASGQGLGATLLQEGRPLAYASRALSDTETRYATIEKEMLAKVFSLEKWHQYTFGRPVVVYSDHKPLEAITKKPLDRAPKRLQGVLVRALAYDIKVQYLNGKDVDTLSRAFLPKASDDGQEEFETVNALTYLVMPDKRIREIRQHTSGDSALQQLKRTIQEGWPDNKSSLPPLIVPYFSIRDELAVTGGLVFRGERLVIPKSMRSEIKNDIHSGHLGVESCLRHASEHVFWPGMKKELKEWIQTCETCREFEQIHCKETLVSHEIPERAWRKIAADLFTYKNKKYLITVCYKSNFWELDRLYDIKSSIIIKKLKAHLARYGIPKQLASDNGPQFDSNEFKKFTKSC
ncbi:hypothetical protein ACROYT_G016169 [Oculina patagonica]